MNTPLREYVTIEDCTNGMFNRFTEAKRQKSIDKANLECEDLAKRRGITDLTTIASETHFKLVDYLVTYAERDLAQQNIGFNNDGTSVEDKYETWYKRSTYILQGLKPQITKSVFTGIDETQESRAIVSQKIYRN